MGNINGHGHFGRRFSSNMGALVPSLLSGAGTWLGDIREAVKLCNTIQAFYWQVVPSLHSDHLSQVWNQNDRFEMANMGRKVITTFQGPRLGSRVFGPNDPWASWRERLARTWQICQDLGIPDVNKYKIRKSEIQKAISKSQYDDMMNQFACAQKLQDIENSNLSNFQGYFNDKNIR